ncbi:MAG: polymerase subunit sigma-24 [Mucilaginibacter sp.]|nr:polymerase subunit sigma-24 [Mucilaginibacter sp.]
MKNNQRLMENEIKDLDNLIAGCTKQDRKCQKLLYKSFYGFTMAICLRYARNRHEATEIMNKGFLNFFFNLQNYDFQKPIKTLLGPVMIHTSISYYRAELTEPIADGIENVNLAYNQPLEDHSLGYRQLLAKVQQLPDLQRLVYNLYAIDGYSDRETDKLLGKSEGTCKFNLMNARETLRKMMNYEKQQL